MILYFVQQCDWTEQELSTFANEMFHNLEMFVVKVLPLDQYKNLSAPVFLYISNWGMKLENNKIINFKTIAMKNKKIEIFTATNLLYHLLRW